MWIVQKIKRESLVIQLPDSSLTALNNYKKFIKNVIAKLLRKSANKLPTSGTNKNALTDGAYFSHTACIFAIAFGVAPIPNPQTPDESTAAS